MILQDLITAHGVDVLDHLDREASIPVLAGLQRQGDIIVIPSKDRADKPVGPEGVPVVRGESGGNTHLLLADGPVFCDTQQARADRLTIAHVTVPEGSVGWLAHPEHGYMGIAPGRYEIRRQREQADELRMVQD